MAGAGGGRGRLRSPFFEFFEYCSPHPARPATSDEVRRIPESTLRSFSFAGLKVQEVSGERYITNEVSYPLARGGWAGYGVTGGQVALGSPKITKKSIKNEYG